MRKGFAVLVLCLVMALAAIGLSPRWNVPLLARTLYARAAEARYYARLATDYAREAMADRAERRAAAHRNADRDDDSRIATRVPDPHPAPVRSSLPSYDDIPQTSRAVRPGSTLALRARRIDATIHPPLVRAREAVADLPSHIPKPSTPLVIGVIGTSVILLAFAMGGVGPQRIAVGLAPLLLLGLTSFHPVPDPPAKRIAAPRDIVHRGRSWADRSDRRNYASGYGQAAPVQVEIPDVPDLTPDVMIAPLPPEHVQMPDMEIRMAERMREWNYRQEILDARRAARARARQEILERRLHEQICEIAREQGLDCGLASAN